MSILNRTSDGLLSVLVALRRALVAYGPQEEDRLLALCAPPSVVPAGKPEMARRTLTRWKQLGVFEEIEGRIQLHPDVALVMPDDLEGFRRALLPFVLAPRNNPLLVENRQDSDGEGGENSLASDFARAAAWVLAQDPYAFSAKHSDVDRLQAQQKVVPIPFINNTRWNGFEEWAPFLGVAWTASRVGLVPDPAFAVRSAMTEVFAGIAELAQEVFLARLAQTLPIVDGGQYWRAVERQVERPWRRIQEHEVSPCLSLALLHLESGRDIRLETRSDAPQKVLLGRGGRELRLVSHVVRLGASHV